MRHQRKRHRRWAKLELKLNPLPTAVRPIHRKFTVEAQITRPIPQSSYSRGRPTGAMGRPQDCFLWDL